MNKKLELEVFFDAGIKPHPNGGFARCYGWVIKSNNMNLKEGRAIEVGQDNVGSCAVEFEALSLAMKDLAEHFSDATSVQIHGDSRAVIDMCTGLGEPHTEELLAKRQQILDVAGQFENIQFSWLPRELNGEADKLGRIAFAEHTRLQDRITLMNKVNILARRYFGQLYDAAIMAAWCVANTGKRKLANMSVAELSVLLKKVSEIPQLIRQVATA